jgi:hypothetical protein
MSAFEATCDQLPQAAAYEAACFQPSESALEPSAVQIAGSRWLLRTSQPHPCYPLLTVRMPTRELKTRPGARDLLVKQTLLRDPEVMLMTSQI